MKNVLITRFSALGDVAMTIPVVYSVCRSNPDVRFVFVTRKLPASLFVNPPANLEVVAVDLYAYKGIGGLRRLYKELRAKYEIDTYADLHDVLRTKVLRAFMRVGGVKVAKINKDRAGRKRLTREKNKVFAPLKTSIEKYRDLFRSLGLEGKEEFVSLFDRQTSPEIFAAATPPRREGETWIAIAPFAQHAGKIYPLHLMEQVVAQLASRKGYKLFIMGGGEQEAAVFSEWREKYGGNLINMAEKRIGIPAELALLSHCDVMFSMDSANMHLASLVGLRVVSVWGATHPYCGFMGWKQNPEDAVQLDMPCRPCSIYGNKPCRYGNYPCLNNLPPSQLLAAL